MPKERIKNKLKGKYFLKNLISIYEKNGQVKIGAEQFCVNLAFANN